ncbi:MAG: hypothetical protein E7672_00720 [Ruminococcaceae bacterium]|nr:hypothetical protein [Oscillospiraceae bacterium]
MKKTNLLALLLAAIMLVSSLASCANNQTETDPDESLETPADSGSDEIIDEEPKPYYETMEQINMNGWTFSLAGGGEGGDDCNNPCSNIYVEAITGDDFNDALYNRILAIENKYNMDIVTYEQLTNYSNTQDALELSCAAGQPDYHAGYISLEFSQGLVSKGYFRNLHEMPLDLSQPFFDQTSQEALTINGTLFYLHSDASFHHYEAGCTLFYNGSILENKQIKSSPYDLWKEGKWTLDAMYSLMEKAATDTNNDGKYRKGADVLALVGHNFRMASARLASDIEIVFYNNETQQYDIDIDSEPAIAVGDYTKQIWLSPFTAIENTTAQGHEALKKLFKAEKAFFYSAGLSGFRALRDKDDNYGIIMWPTLEENKDPKVHLRNPNALVIPKTVGPDVEDNVATIITALAAYGNNYILDDYIKYAVVAEGARDEESVEVIKYILDNRVYDMSGFLRPVDQIWWDVVESGLYSSTEKSKKASIIQDLLSKTAVYFPETDEETPAE